MHINITDNNTDGPSTLKITCFSKASTSVNGQDLRADKDNPKSLVVNSTNCNIQFGSVRKNNVINVKLVWKSVIFSFSSDEVSECDPTKSFVELMQSAKSKLDIRYTGDLTNSTTHYLKGAKNSSKLLYALLRRIFVVSERFLSKLESLCPDLQNDFEPNWPDEAEFAPDVKYCRNEKRASLFEGVSFVVCKKEDADFLDPLVSLAKGRCLYYPLHKGTPEKQSSDLVEFFKSNENCVLVNLITDANALSFFQKTWGNAPKEKDEECAIQNKIIHEAARILGVEVVSNTELMESIVECDRRILFKSPNKRHLSPPEETGAKRRLLSRRKRGQIKALDTMDVVFFDEIQPSQREKSIEAESLKDPVSTQKKSMRKRPVLIADSFLDEMTQNNQDQNSKEAKEEKQLLDGNGPPETTDEGVPETVEVNLADKPPEHERRKFVFDKENIAKELEEPKVDSQTALYKTLKKAQAIKTQQQGDSQPSRELTKEMVAAVHEMTIVEDMELVRDRGVPENKRQGDWTGKKNFKCFRKVYPKHMGIEQSGSRRINSMREFLSLDSHDVQDDAKRKLQDDQQFMDLSQDQNVPELDDQIDEKQQSALFVQSDEEPEPRKRRPALRSRIPAKRAKSPDSDDGSDDEQPRFRFKR